MGHYLGAAPGALGMPGRIPIQPSSPLALANAPSFLLRIAPSQLRSQSTQNVKAVGRHLRPTRWLPNEKAVHWV